MGLKQNDLVYHTKQPSLGIGCVARVYKTYHKVNFGADKSMKVPPWMLSKVDTSKCKTMTVAQMRSAFIRQEITFLIVGNELKQNVGIGLVTIRVVTEADLIKYPRLIA